MKVAQKTLPLNLPVHVPLPLSGKSQHSHSLLLKACGRALEQTIDIPTHGVIKGSKNLKGKSSNQVVGGIHWMGWEIFTVKQLFYKDRCDLQTHRQTVFAQQKGKLEQILRTVLHLTQFILLSPLSHFNMLNKYEVLRNYWKQCLAIVSKQYMPGSMLRVLLT